MLATAVTNLHRVEMIPAVEDLGRRHAGYGVTAKHYEPVGAALLWTLEQGLGADFSPPVKAAWTETYMTVAGVMQKAAAAVAPAEEGNVRACSAEHAASPALRWTDLSRKVTLAPRQRWGGSASERRGGRVSTLSVIGLFRIPAP